MKLRGLRQVRQRNGLSIGQLAELTGLRRETVARLEQGKEEPQSYAVHRLAAILESSVAELGGALTSLETAHLRNARKQEHLLPAS
jgi:transcriptional regulator with XRE-family HTH domain